MSRLQLIPDCGDEGCIQWWDFSTLSQAELRLLVNLVQEQDRPVDRLGSTATVERMAYLFSAMTGVPTTAEILFQNLVAMRKTGQFPELQKGRRWDKETG